MLLQKTKLQQNIGLVRHGKWQKLNIKRVANAEIRAAKTFLNKKGLTTEEISPKKFATAAKKLDKGFQETLQILARELSGGQV